MFIQSLRNLLVCSAIFAFLLVFPTYGKEQKKAISNQTDVYAEYDICDGYVALLSGEKKLNPDGCDEVSSFLISKRGDHLETFLKDYSVDMLGKAPFAYLVAGLKEWKLYGRDAAGPSFYVIDFASAQLFAAYRGVGDIERAVIYSFLANRTKIQILSGELRADSDVMKHYRHNPLKEILGDEFSMLDRTPAENVLACMLTADNQRVAVTKVVTSHYFHTCLKNNTAER